MAFTLLETVVLARDLPEHGLLAGDLGAIVEIYPGGNIEVEFVRPSGDTQALLTLKEADVRPVSDRDVLAVRAS